MKKIWLITACMIMAPTLTVGAPINEKTAQAQAVLKKHCYRCHGLEGVAEGGFNYVMDISRLVQRGKVISGKPHDSPLFKRIANGTMPPSDTKDVLSAEEKSLVEEWIAGGALPLANEAPRGRISKEQINSWILADLEQLEPRSRRFQRYLSLEHLWNAGAGEDELRTYRNALYKSINSLSWHPKIRNPIPIDRQETLFRIDLRWYLWDATLWNRILGEYPYGILEETSTARLVSVFTATRVPTIRADWFIATATRPPLYQEILQLPGNLAELERQLRVDPNINITQERVMRVAFNGSGIAKNNRVLERHDAAHGYYWRTYDFEDIPQNLIDRGLLAPDRRNVFAYPLGPGSVENTFLHAGGEAIFSLPNGLQGYYIMNDANNRLDKAPVAIVSDPKRPDRAVELGISCMGCHSTGILPKADQMHNHLLKNSKGVPKQDREIAMALYPSAKVSTAQMEEDSKQFLTALKLTGNQVTRLETTIGVTLRYEADIDASTAAAEAGMTLEDFRNQIGKHELLSRALGSLLIPGGTVSRIVWIQTFGDLVRDFKLGTLFQANQIGAALPDNTGELDPLEVTSGHLNAAVFSEGGKTAIIADANRTLRIFDVQGNRTKRSLTGHTASVWCVAHHEKTNRILSGSMDGTSRYWDADNGDTLQVLQGHSGLVSAVAFTDDGWHGLTGGIDGWVILWDLRTGKEIRRWKGPMKYIQAIAVQPRGKSALLASGRTIYHWDFDNGKVIQEYAGSSANISCVAFGKNGKHWFTGGDDGTIQQWTSGNTRATNTYRAHTGPVSSIEESANGKWLASCGSDRTVRLWHAGQQKELAVFQKHSSAVAHVNFTPTGRQTVSADRQGNVLIWNLAKWVEK
ncbi:MAG: WD40 repeat domain-containing protein [Zavarzinella sp.]